MKIEQVPWSDPDAAELRTRQRAELAVRYGRPDSEPGVPPSEADIAVFFVARAADGTALGCGGLRYLGEGVGEIKRMYVEPAARGTGVAARLLRTLEEWARARSGTALHLETGTAQPDAIRFYTRSGYTRIPNFGPYATSPLSLCFTRPL